MPSDIAIVPAMVMKIGVSKSDNRDGTVGVRVCVRRNEISCRTGKQHSLVAQCPRSGQFVSIHVKGMAQPYYRLL